MNIFFLAFIITIEGERYLGSFMIPRIALHQKLLSGVNGCGLQPEQSNGLPCAKCPCPVFLRVRNDYKKAYEEVSP